MKCVCAVQLLASIACVGGSNADASSQDIFQPHRISFEALTQDLKFESARGSFLEALSQVGMVSITNIQGLNKNDMLSALQQCAKHSQSTQVQVLEDGTRRLTMATHTISGPGGMKQLAHGSPTASCEDFSKASDSFREMAGKVTQVFSKRLANLLALEDNVKKPLLMTRDGYSFDTFSDVVENGNHLEHFHSYQGSGAGMNTPAVEKKDKAIDWHTDQGLFIVFTPAQLVQERLLKGLSSGFYIKTRDGSERAVEFRPEDDLIVMLGDGVNQFVNPSRHTSSQKLRATPHALSMPLSLGDQESRVWYGRMVLPPMSAIHPQHQETFGQLREQLVLKNNNNNKDTLLLGCSPTAQARSLQTTACEDQEGTMYCWHRCMSLEDYGVSESICAEQGLLNLTCINPRGQLWDQTHGDFYPGCADISTAEIATDYPPLPDAATRPDQECSEDRFEALLSSIEEDEDGTSDNNNKIVAYDHTLDLTTPDEQDGGTTTAVFQWSVRDGRVQGRLSYNGIFGYLALGLPMPGGAKKGMHGARTILALPGGNYSPVTGLDLTMDDTVNEYVIDPHKDKSAFRHWSTPVVSTLDGNNGGDDATTDIATSRSSSGNRLASYSVHADECFTVLTFDTSRIHDFAFNLTGTDRLIWAANSEDGFAGYHTARGEMMIHWPTGKASIGGDEALLGDLEGTKDDKDVSSAGSSAGGFYHESKLLLVAVASTIGLLVM